MSGNEIREKYLRFMEDKGHAIVPSAALVPENDPTTLFTGSGMQPLIPYLMGEKHPKGTRLTDSQKCFRANDIEEVGDNRHTTFFEMLGNWSLGDYFKQDQLRWFFTFLVDEVGLDPAKIYVTVFAGDESLGIPRDDESVAIWQELFRERGIEAKAVHIGSEEDGYEVGMQGGRIFYYDAAKNWWSRSGKPENMPSGEIGGPDSEVFYDFGPEYATHPDFKDKEPHPNSDSGQFLEIGNSVFIEYVKKEDGSFAKLPQSNVDFGGGLERIAAARNNEPDVFKVDLLWNVAGEIESISGKKYEDNLVAFRVITDHIRGAVFMIGDGVFPANDQQGYFVRRLLRRAVRYADRI
ncbi:MAG: alanine--tRNA ligase-related protein, partial [Candidatus Paceibacterota bacterium]